MQATETKLEITKELWGRAKPADRKVGKDGTRYMKCRLPGGKWKWSPVFWRR